MAFALMGLASFLFPSSFTRGSSLRALAVYTGYKDLMPSILFLCFGMACTTGAFCLLVCFCPALRCS